MDKPKAQEKPKTLIERLGARNSNITKADHSKGDVDDEDEHHFAPSASSSTLPSPVDVLRKELANYVATMKETARQMAAVKNTVDDMKRSQSAHSLNHKMRCISAEELARQCRG